MKLRAYGICRTCSQPYPVPHSCPGCHEDAIAAQEMLAAQAIAHASDSPYRIAREYRMAQWKRRQAAAIVGLLVSSLTVGTLLLLLGNH